MDSLKYQEILEENIMPSVRKLKLGDHLPTGKLAQAYLKCNQGLFSEEVLEDSTVTITVT